MRHSVYAAIVAAGLTEAEFCRRARVSRSYLRTLCREGAPYDTALRMTRVLGCDLMIFIPQHSPGAGRSARQRRRGAVLRRGGSPVGRSLST